MKYYQTIALVMLSIMYTTPIFGAEKSAFNKELFNHNVCGLIDEFCSDTELNVNSQKKVYDKFLHKINHITSHPHLLEFVSFLQKGKSSPLNCTFTIVIFGFLKLLLRKTLSYTFPMSPYIIHSFSTIMAIGVTGIAFHIIYMRLINSHQIVTSSLQMIFERLSSSDRFHEEKLLLLLDAIYAKILSFRNKPTNPSYGYYKQVIKILTPGKYFAFKAKNLNSLIVAPKREDKRTFGLIYALGDKSLDLYLADNGIADNGLSRADSFYIGPDSDVLGYNDLPDSDLKPPNDKNNPRPFKSDYETRNKLCSLPLSKNLDYITFSAKGEHVLAYGVNSAYLWKLSSRKSLYTILNPY